jgi:hypothetical protein
MRGFRELESFKDQDSSEKTTEKVHVDEKHGFCRTGAGMMVNKTPC